MADQSTRNDIDRVGLTEKSRQALDELVNDGYFKDSLSGYRLAVSLAIKNQIDISDHTVIRPQGHMYLISQVDPDSIFATVISELFPQYKEEKYRALEKFADLGILQLKIEIEKSASLIFWEKSTETTNLSV